MSGAGDVDPRTAEHGRAWDDLHGHARFRPAWPSEATVRFAARHVEPGDLVLDAGSGAGRHAGFAVGQGARVVACDLSHEGLVHTRRGLLEGGAAPTVARSTLQHLPFDTAAFAAAICHGVLPYATGEGFQHGIDELARVLRPGGWLLAVIRTTDDVRATLGPEVEPGTFRLDSDLTNERGMLQHLLARDDVDRVFGGFAELVVDRLDHTAGGGTITNSDWVIEARR